MTSIKLTARLHWLDIARTLALAGMIVFHFTYDLAMFGYVMPETPFALPFSVLARVVAGSFLGMAGFSLYLAHGQGIRWRAFLRRLALLSAAAAVITVATWFAMPEAFIFFGILHSIALCSVLGLAFLRQPAWVNIPLAAFVAVLPYQARFELLDAAWLRFVGLGTVQPLSADFEPLFPWFGAFLLGLGLAQVFARTGWLQRRPAGPGIRALGWPGRYSLWVYLAHQPVLISLIWAWAKLNGHI